MCWELLGALGGGVTGVTGGGYWGPLGGRLEPYWEHWEGAAGGLGELVWRGERLGRAWTSEPEGLGGTGRDCEGLWGCAGVGGVILGVTG